MLKILAVASSGGHWAQLMRITTAFDNAQVTFVSTRPSEASEHNMSFYSVPEGNIKSKVKLAYMLLRVAIVVGKTRPDIVISTGAAPGFFALFIGKLMGSRTIWLDSIANSDKLSLSGRQVGRWADAWLTQWPHLARPGGPEYWGKVL
jgi:exopolysaccharide biosynthesis glucuronosyltransferase PssD